MGNPTNHYTYKIEWSDEGEEWVGTVLELPNLSWLDKTPDQALNGIQQVARECVDDMTKQGKEPPIPLSDRYRSRLLGEDSPPLVGGEESPFGLGSFLLGLDVSSDGVLADVPDASEVG